MYVRLKEMPEAQITELRKLVIDIDKSWNIKGNYQREYEQKRLNDKLFSLTGYKALMEPELTVLKDFEIKSNIIAPPLKKNKYENISNRHRDIQPYRLRKIRCVSLFRAS
jgi:hypothetical protein